MAKKIWIQLAAAALIAAAPAFADDTSAAFEQPLGLEYGQSERPFEPGTRDANGNRLVISGRIIEDGSNLPWGLGFGESPSGFAQGTAVGNQLNVITNGNFNTVIIDNVQINNGDQNAVINGGK
jgi:holdfast attachment protein HfaA